MDEQKKQKMNRRIFLISLIPLAACLIYIIYCAVEKKEFGLSYYILLALCLGLHWAISDVVSIIWTKGFEGRTEAQISAYRKYALIDLVGYAGLGYFAFAVGSNNGIIGGCVYIMTLSIKRKYLDKYKGIVKEEEAEEDEEISETEEIEEETEIPEIEEKTEE